MSPALTRARSRSTPSGRSSGRTRCCARSNLSKIAGAIVMSAESSVAKAGGASYNVPSTRFGRFCASMLPVASGQQDHLGRASIVEPACGERVFQVGGPISKTMKFVVLLAPGTGPTAASRGEAEPTVPASAANFTVFEAPRFRRSCLRSPRGPGGHGRPAPVAVRSSSSRMWPTSTATARRKVGSVAVPGPVAISV
jgi:hypothetical protein